MKSIPRLILALFAVFFLAQCAGYRLGAVKPSELADIQRIAIPTFSNDTLEPRINALLTNAVINEMLLDGSYRIGTLENSDAVLYGKITNIDRRQLRSVRTDVLRTRELEVSVQIEYSLEHADTGAILAKGVARGRSDIFLDPNFQLSERQGIQKAGEEAAKSLVSAISEGF